MHATTAEHRAEVLKHAETRHGGMAQDEVILAGGDGVMRKGQMNARTVGKMAEVLK